MADHEATKIDKANHLLLDQPLIRLPYELLRKNFRSAHFIVEKESTAVKNALKDAATASLDGRTAASPTGQEDLLKSLDALVVRMRGVKRKLTACADEEAKLYQQVDARTAHLADLSAMHTLDDVTYETWSRRRLDRLLVDYLLRHGYQESAKALVDKDERDQLEKHQQQQKQIIEQEQEQEQTPGIGFTKSTTNDTTAHDDGDSLTADKTPVYTLRDLVDMDTFSTMTRIRQRLLRDHSVAEALAWCTDNKKELRKMESKLEFMLRLQQYIELARTQELPRLSEAIVHARRYLTPLHTTYPDECRQAFALFCYAPDDAPDAYAALWCTDRWVMLADLFTTTYYRLLGLPSIPLLHLALSSGLSALKTPACHSATSAGATVPLALPTAAPSSMPASGSASASLTLLGLTNPPTSAVGSLMANTADSGSGADSYAHSQSNRGASTHRHYAGQIGASVCPICSPELNELARHVPYAHHSKSHVEHDVVLLPNGRAYGRTRLEAYARKAGLPADYVRDLRTGDVYHADKLLKVYIT